MDVKLCYLRFIGGVFIFMMMLLCAVAAFAQDFEPDRRPEAGLYLSVDSNKGTVTDVGYANATLTGAGSPVVTSKREISTVAGSYRLPANAAFANPAYTASCWFMINSSDASSYFQVFSALSNTETNGPSRWFGVTPSSSGKRALFGYVFRATPSSALVYYDSGTTKIVDFTWNHLCAVSNGSSLKLYLNGGLISTTAHNSATLTASTQPPHFGSYYSGTTPSIYTPALYRMVEFRSGVALTDGEVYSLYVSTKAEP